MISGVNMTAMIRRVRVWSAGLRVTHWLAALLLMVLMATALVFRNLAQWYDAALDWHVIAGQALALVLLLRLWLALTGKGSDRASAWFASLRQPRAMLAMLRFYVTLGRSPLPHWYAHNPLWAPLYAVFWLLTGLAILSALLVGSGGDGGVSGPAWAVWHVRAAEGLMWFVLIHLIAVFLHDLKGDSADCSAMINGHRYFSVSADKPAVPEVQNGKQVRVDFDKQGAQSPGNKP